MNLFWIPTKTLNFSNQCSVVKTHERDNLPTSPSKTVKLSFINQKKNLILVLDSLQIFVVLPYFGLHNCQRVVFDCHGLIWITGDVSHFIWMQFESHLILCKFLLRNLTKVVLTEPTLVIAWKQHNALLVQMAVKESEQSWMQLAWDSMTYDKSRKPLITLNI